MSGGSLAGTRPGFGSLPGGSVRVGSWCGIRGWVSGFVAAVFNSGVTLFLLGVAVENWISYCLQVWG